MLEDFLQHKLSLCHCKHFKQNTKNNPSKAVQVGSQALTDLTIGNHYMIVSHLLNSLTLVILPQIMLSILMVSVVSSPFL